MIQISKIDNYFFFVSFIFSIIIISLY